MHRPHKQEQEPASEEVIEVAPGILRAQLPVDLTGLGHVNCYLMEDERGLAVVDPGLPGPDAWTAFVDRLDRAGYRTTDVHTVVVTHSHVDHFGAASRLCQENRADLVTHATFRNVLMPGDDAGAEDSASLEVNSADERGEVIERWLRRRRPWGGARERAASDVLARFRAIDPTLRPFFEPLAPTRAVVDAQTVRLGRREWVAMHTPGHTPDHLCLFDPEHGVVLTGDHVLPTITPHIGGVSATDEPLSQYFASLERVADVPGVIALPAHGHPFRDLRGRTREIARHHEERLDVIRRATGELRDGTVNDFMRALFRESSWGSLAESETYAHLEHLRERGELVRTTDPNGNARYRRVA